MPIDPQAPSPFDDAPVTSKPHAPGPGQFSFATLALVTFDIAFVLGWWANATSKTALGEAMASFTGRVIFSTLRVGIISFPFWTCVFAFLPALLGASLGSALHQDVEHRRRVRGASLFWTLISAIFVEFVARSVWASVIMDPDGHLLFFAFGDLGCAGLGLLAWALYLAMISAGYGLVISLALSLLGRWKMIPLTAPWKDAPWRAMKYVGFYGPLIWLTAFLFWAICGMPKLLEVSETAAPPINAKLVQVL
jgi:hypothetical protein